MIRYRYVQTLTPPAPFVYVLIHCFATGAAMPEYSVVRAALGRYEPHVLLGRDVLNYHDILLQGSQQAVDIAGAPPRL